MSQPSWPLNDAVSLGSVEEFDSCSLQSDFNEIDIKSMERCVRLIRQKGGVDGQNVEGEKMCALDKWKNVECELRAQHWARAGNTKVTTAPSRRHLKSQSWLETVISSSSVSLENPVNRLKDCATTFH